MFCRFFEEKNMILNYVERCIFRISSSSLLNPLIFRLVDCTFLFAFLLSFFYFFIIYHFLSFINYYVYILFSALEFLCSDMNCNIYNYFIIARISAYLAVFIQVMVLYVYRHGIFSRFTFLSLPICLLMLLPNSSALLLILNFNRVGNFKFTFIILIASSFS